VYEVCHMQAIRHSAEVCTRSVFVPLQAVNRLGLGSMDCVWVWAWFSL